MGGLIAIAVWLQIKTKRVEHERNKAVERVRALDAIRDQERAVRKKLVNVDDEARSVADEQNEARRRGVRPDRFGDRRLHKDDNS